MMIRRVNTLTLLIQRELSPLIKADPPRLDSVGRRRLDGLGEVRATITLIQTLWIDQNEPSALVVRRHGESAERFGTKEALRTVHSLQTVAGLPVAEELVAPWVTENVRLIKTIDSRHFADIEKVIADGYLEGQSTDRIAKELQKRAAISRRRAKTIARDQMGTLNSNVTQKRYTDLGITSYVWVDSGDEKVRPTHEDFNGQVFSYTVGSPEGHAGEPIGCRCTQRAVLIG